MKTAAYIIMLALCAGIVVMNYKLNGQPRKEQVYMVQFIFMTIAFVIMLIVAILQQRRIKELNKKYHDMYDEGFQKYYGFGKLYRRKYKYMVIENAGDNGTLNRTAEKYHDEGYDLDREKSTDRLLVFVKSEEVKED